MPLATHLPRVPRPVDAVLTQLRAAIVDGSYPAGQHLPPERQLSATLGVSRLTLRAAVARLESEGLVRARQGDGVRVLDVMDNAGLAVLSHVDIVERPDILRSFLELRRAVAIEAVAQACERATARDVALLERLAAEQTVETDQARYIERDVAFAREVLRAARAFATLLLFNTLIPISAAHPEFSKALVDDRERSLAGYTVTIALIRGGDAEAARTLLRQALEDADSKVLQAFARRRRANKKVTR